MNLNEKSYSRSHDGKKIIQVVVQVAPPQKARNKARRKHRQRKPDNYSDVSSCDDYSSDDDDVSPYRSAKREQEPKNLGKPFSATPSATEAFDYENKWTNGICNCCSNVTGCCFAHLCTVCYTCRLFDKAHEDCCMVVLCPCALCTLRTKIRAQYRIKGSIWRDYLTFFCVPLAACAIVQMRSELDAN